ncbi:hypothetical protein ES332_A05G264500v1 [Gossypium tomentosum]|uniref:Myb-like domain-containing protein n=1 Tax=Gossypium tomentosum TaxID=34277 RepID=A0A5D2QJZ3_GOSTO|nr:hypothetical protein ES332_A05G264500v1 [Gossypium tomentosum]
MESSMVEGSAEAATTVAGILEGSEGEEDRGRVDEGDRSFGGNRWPRQETLALLKIRSDMDSLFRDSTLKGPLWEEVSRKLAELGYHRSAKKCKEKFENVYKYHKRTKDGRTSKADGKTKTYRFFDELEAFQNLHSLQPLSPPKPQTPTPTSASVMNPTNVPQSHATVPSINPTLSTQPVPPLHSINPCFINISSNLFSTSTSSSTTSNDDSYQGSSGKKRKWKEFFRRLTKEVIEKQEELQNKFLQTIERCEQQRLAREEAWRVQEMARINKEHELLVQERSKAAAKDAAVFAFLQKVSGQQPNTVQGNPQPQPQPPPPAQPMLAPLSTSLPPPPPPPVQVPQPKTHPPPTQALNFDTSEMSNGGNSAVSVSLSPSPSRWPKVEVEALIKLRTNLDIKYQDNGPKGPLWEEISAAMRNLGYNRSAKRCKEKWENINKYFKKVKENNKTRPEDSKTCPYFHQLDAIHKDKISKNGNSLASSSPYGVKPDSRATVPLMVLPEQQWPPPRQANNHQAETVAMMEEEADKGNVGHNNNHIQEEEEEEEGDTEDEYEGNDFELVAKTAPIGSGGE